MTCFCIMPSLGRGNKCTYWCWVIASCRITKALHLLRYWQVWYNIEWDNSLHGDTQPYYKQSGCSSSYDITFSNLLADYASGCLDLHTNRVCALVEAAAVVGGGTTKTCIQVHCWTSIVRLYHDMTASHRSQARVIECARPMLSVHSIF